MREKRFPRAAAHECASAVFGAEIRRCAARNGRREWAIREFHDPRSQGSARIAVKQWSRQVGLNREVILTNREGRPSEYPPSAADAILAERAITGVKIVRIVPLT
jgi:hypothetical protein